MKNNQKFSDLVSDACSSQGISMMFNNSLFNFILNCFPVDRHTGIQT